MKTIAIYLPQFHEVEENNRWWGKGFTDWVTVRNAKPLYIDHRQPRVPLGKNYYDLLNHDVMQWQAELAREPVPGQIGLFDFLKQQTESEE